MTELIINGACMLDRQTAHDELFNALQLPEYYGRNLDALSDAISGIQIPVRMRDTATMLNALGVYGCKLLQVFYASPISFTAE